MLSMDSGMIHVTYRSQEEPSFMNRSDSSAEPFGFGHHYQSA